MDHAVALFGAAPFLFGTALGLRFRVYVLIPAGIMVLTASAVAWLSSDKAAGWGVLGMVASLIVLNVGFAFGLLLRAGAAFLHTRATARLFAREGSIGRSSRPQGRIGREASADGVGPV